jgi:hypothetical protein
MLCGRSEESAGSQWPKDDEELSVTCRSPHGGAPAGCPQLLGHWRYELRGKLQLCGQRSKRASAWTRAWRSCLRAIQVFPGFPPLGEVYRTTKNLAISYRHVFSPRVVNEFTTGFSRFIFFFTQGEANPSFPNVLPYSFANASLPYINTPRTFRAVTTPQLSDNLSVIKGSHIFPMGANVRLYEHNDQRGQPGGINVTPSLQFSATTRPPTGFTTPAVATSSTVGINSTD